MNLLGGLIESQGEMFEIHRGAEVLQAKGLKNREKSTGRPYIGFYPDADVRQGDKLRGLVSGNEVHVIGTERQLLHGQPSQLKAFYRESTFQETVQPVSISVGSMVNSAIQQGSPGAFQSVTITQQNRESVAGVLDAIAAAVDKLGLSPSDSSELSSEIETVRAQLKHSKPKPTVIRECLASVKQMLENVASSAVVAGTTALASGLVERIAGLLPSLGG